MFDRTPHAWGKVEQWARRCDEFAKRAAFALLASLTAHDKGAEDESFAQGLHLIEHAATVAARPLSKVKDGADHEVRGTPPSPARVRRDVFR